MLRSKLVSYTRDVGGLREFTVRVLDVVYKSVYAHDRYGAASQAVRLYRKSHPGYTFVQLMSVVSAHLVHPEPLGRKTIPYE